MAACAGGLLDRFRSAVCVGAARFETNDRLSFDQPSRLLHAGSFCAGRVTRCCCEDRHARGAKWRVHANLQSRHYRGDAFLLCGPARTTARSAWHRRFRWPDAADTAALRLDECRHVFVARFAGVERICWRVFDFQRLVRDGSGLHGHCRDWPFGDSHRLYASDAISLQRTTRRRLQRVP